MLVYVEFKIMYVDFVDSCRFFVDSCNADFVTFVILEDKRLKPGICSKR